MVYSEFRLQFQDDKERADFEAAFQSWMKQYQKFAGTAKAAAQGIAPSAAPSQEVRRFGFGPEGQPAAGAPQGLAYIDFIPGW